MYSIYSVITGDICGTHSVLTGYIHGIYSLQYVMFTVYLLYVGSILYLLGTYVLPTVYLQGIYVVTQEHIILE